MAEIVIAIAAKVAEVLVKPTIRQGQYLFCVNKVIKNLDNEKEELKVERDSIQDRKEQAEKRTEKVVDSVDKWLNDVRNLLDEVEQLEQDVKERHCVQGWCPTWRRYRLCKEMAKKTETITDLKAKSNFKIFSRLTSLPGIEYVSSQNFTFYESTKAAYSLILEALQDDKAYMIGLYGMGGSGKTTLATEVGKKALEFNLFDRVIPPVTVSQTPNIRSIQGKMADMLKLKLEEESEEGRAQRLWLRLKGEKRVLIIVDDVWAKFELEQIGIRLDDINKLNFKVLLTTRRRGVCELMDCQKQIFLKHLSDSDAWSLFQKHVDIGDGSSSNLLEVAREVSNECKGLPIAIKAVGSSLKGKGDNEWKVALEILRNPERFDDNGEEGFTEAYTCLKLSYDYLKNKEAEMLFLMCCMFPEDHEILIEDLIRYGVGLGVCGNFNSFDLARSSIRAGINKLVDSCLLFRYENKEPHVMMHDVIRDVAVQIASRSEDRKILVNVSQDLNALAENGAVKDYFAISLWYKGTDLISYQLDAPKLEILLLKTKNKNSLDFSFASSDGVKELKVMSIHNSSYYDPQSLLLLRSTQWLTHLRTLCLSGWKLGDLSFLINLTGLEALDLRNCHLTELPKGMEKLNKLKLLDFSGCVLPENVNYELLASFSQLEELYVSFGRIPSEVIKDIVTLPNLQRFRITTYFDNTDYGESTRVLSLNDFDICDLSASKQNLLQRATHFSLQGLHGGCKNVIPDMVRVVGGMNELTNLCFSSCSEIECLIDTTYGSFQVDTSLPKLVKLELSIMYNLKEVFRGPPLLVLGFFEKLEQLFIIKCPKLHSIFAETCNLCNLKILKIGNYGDRFPINWSDQDCTIVVSLFSLSVAQSLQQLEELSIEGCKKLKHIITIEGEGGINTGDNSQLMFPNLKKILVRFCPKLDFLFPISFALQGLLQLQEIKISHASELKYVFFQHDHEAYSSHQNQIQIMLAQLKVFELHNLENLLGICPENYHLRYPSLVKLSYGSFPKLTTSYINETVSSTQRQHHLNKGVAIQEDQQNHLTSNLQQLELHELPQLKFIWSGSTPIQVLSFQFLQFLKLDGCANLKSIFSIAVGRNLPELTSLSIYRCEELEEIMVENEVPQNLSNTEVCFPKLREVVIKECNKLKSLFSVAMVEMPPQLSTLHISEAAQLEVVFRCSSEDNTDNEEIMLPNLRKLELEKLPSFVNIFRRFNFQAPKLRELSTNECPKFDPVSRGTQGLSFQHTKEERHVLCLITAIWSELCGRRFCAALEAFLNLEVLSETKSRVQGIFHLQVEGETNSTTEWKPLYSNLRELKLCDLPELRFIWKGFPKFLSLKKLKKVSIVDCPKLKTIFSSDIVRCLPYLQNLSISNCKELEEIIFSDSENAQLRYPFASPQQEVCFPSLTKIEVKQCNKLKCLFYYSDACHFSMLYDLTVEECCQLESGFKIEADDKSFQREANEDVHLEWSPKLDLTVVDCPKYSLTSNESKTSCLDITTQEGQVFWLITTSSSLQAFLNFKELHLIESRAKGIFQLQVEGETSNNSEWKLWKSNLYRLELCNLPELRFIWNGFSKFMSLENLQNVSLVECPKLKTIFSPDIVKCFPNLWNLSISNCEELEEIISLDSGKTQLRLPSSCPKQEVCFPQLQNIEVKQCNKLKCLLYDSMTCHFPELESLEIEECSQLEQIVEFKIEGGDKSFQREASEDGLLILFPKLDYLFVMDCPKYRLTSRESSTSCQHVITQGHVFWLITTSSSLQSFLILKQLYLTKSRAECIFQLQVEGEISSNNEWMPLNSSLRYLTLHDLPELRFIWKNFSKFSSLEKLKEVSLVNCPQLKSIFSPCIVRCLPKLKTLLISNCEKLEEIVSSDLENAQLRHPTAGPQQEVCFPRLIKIEVKQCNKLKCLFYDSMAYHFPKLKSLEIEECSQIEQVFGSKGRADDESSQRCAKEDGDRILLPKLRKLVLRSLPIFFEISRGFNLSQPMHKYLVTDCPKYNSTLDEASTSYQHTTTQGEHSDEESQESSDGEFW